MNILEYFYVKLHPNLSLNFEILLALHNGASKRVSIVTCYSIYINSNHYSWYCLEDSLFLWRT